MRGRGRGAVAVLKAAHSFNVPGLPEVRAEEDEWSRFAIRCHPAAGSNLLVGDDQDEDEEEEEEEQDEEEQDEEGLGLGLHGTTACPCCAAAGKCEPAHRWDWSRV